MISLWDIRAMVVIINRELNTFQEEVSLKK